MSHLNILAAFACKNLHTFFSTLVLGIEYYNFNNHIFLSLNVINVLATYVVTKTFSSAD